MHVGYRLNAGAVANKYLSYSRETARRLLNFESQTGKKLRLSVSTEGGSLRGQILG